ncbi:hypothetical protein [Granulosicoccus antarcticus]|uniref:Intracellular proteinase inhibitor BsuPI domain-containing protein n=1 Tax=Granulosicoccus antarcticus IMCC3135 TaxID=1192854 RepID=A0A2Z2P3P8_9GAMM|nr:hypothetical protein [Granulosicoccus antarcticus]ASJ74434.1 hypothetical protein IMCC3135_21790 [Granulosicoccus antarcticus IMCC3135]
MMHFKTFAVFALMMVLGGSACSASEQINKVVKMPEDSMQAVLVAGIEADDDKAVRSELTFYVRNNSDTEIDLLIWNTPLERNLSADVFTVTLDGEPVAYEGRMVKRSSPSEEDYLKIPAHERVDVQMNIADYYAMSAPGEYAVSFTPTTIDGHVHLNEQTLVQLETETLSIRIESQ